MVPAGEAVFPWNALSPLRVIGSDSFIPGLCPIAASDPAIWILLLYPWIFSGGSAMSLRLQVQPYFAHEVKGCGRIPKCFHVAGDATGDVNRGGNRVFNIS